MKTSTAINYFGSINELAYFLNLSRDSIYKWGEVVPKKRQYELEIKTAGALKSEYTINKEKAEQNGNIEKADR